jgi:predicted enzyme related to lactoylglutathione lyase
LQGASNLNNYFKTSIIMPRVVHFEIVANDSKSAKEFYEAVFGWEFNQLDSQEYWVIKTG